MSIDKKRVYEIISKERVCEMIELWGQTCRAYLKIKLKRLDEERESEKATSMRLWWSEVAVTSTGRIDLR